MYTAARSLILPEGFRCSALARMRQPVIRERDLISTKGVFPTVPAKPSTTWGKGKKERKYTAWMGRN
jgi:hypothetical protein